ncbi:MAG TPA: hypothetical protein VIC55_07480 [Gemmatimonadaceae bacterium]
MAKPKKTQRSTPATSSPFEEARDELFQHIMRCGVVGTDAADQQSWFDDTMQYMTDRFPELPAERIEELRKLGERFAQPPKRHAEADASAA